MLIGYMRVSKADGSQGLDLQRDALLAVGVKPSQLYEDQASGKKDDRPGLEACLKSLRDGDTLIVWKLDRLGRNLRHLVNTITTNKLFSFPVDPEGALRARSEFTEFLQGAVDERRAEPRDDLISRLVDAQKGDTGLSDEEVYSFVRLLFPAGVHNTSNALGNTIWALLTQISEGFERVRSEHDAAHWAVEETLRWEGPLPVLPRRSVLERDWYGETVPAGALVVLSQAAAHRDPSAYADADRFDLDRHPEDLLVLGLGAHFCIGAALARQEVRTAIEILAARCRGLRLVNPDEAHPAGGAQRGPRALRVEIDW